MNTERGISRWGRGVLCAAAALLLAPNSHAADGDLLDVYQSNTGVRDEKRDALGNRYGAFTFEGTVDVDPGPGVLEFSQHNTENSTRDTYVHKLDPSGQLVWALHLPGALFASVAPDAEGNVYVAAVLRDTLVLDDAGTPIEIPIERADSVAVLIKLDAEGKYIWSRRFAAPSNFLGCNASLGWISVSPAGNVMGFGSFYLFMDADPGPDEVLLDWHDGEAFLITIDPDGNLVDVKQDFGSNVLLTMAADGSFYSFGTPDSGADVEPGPGVFNVPSQHGFFSRFSAEGERLWTKVIQGEYATTCEFLSLDSQGNILITGSFSPTADLDPGPGEAILNAPPGQGFAYVAKYDADGNYLWGNALGGDSDYLEGAGGTFVYADESGAVYTIGVFYDSMTFAAEARPITITSAGETDIFITKHTADGQFRWVKQIGNTSFNRPYFCFLFPGEGLYVWGSIPFTEPLDVDPGFGEILLERQAGSSYRLLFETSDIAPVVTRHSADLNDDQVISLAELLRVIQFFNSDGYQCAESPMATEDGFQPGIGATNCAPHTADYGPQDWVISLSELLRAIQFYNSGAYHSCPGAGSEDGFCPGSS